MDPEEKAALKRLKIAAGLTPAQADEAIAAQAAWDADPNHPDNQKPSKAGKSVKDSKDA